ncbi:hypothetical protein BG74_04635 [Sodalis-like endosymbiont of Proechinophthirus fluctus]|uniref:class II fructose-bisphosphate aldolase n=1 Tax=Sodalis-like endosymbiont of Proechinophthirus fluctus TaxID=1462730 RepID=UPI0007A8ACBA|nr:class II fructose-bisphosphate aldolase [Sodalis-like endosymbiont of Proechinophthirus fluctus]KYP97249.1 hypothetical protein BG74_04635 [Sodalis-like endosymbiont of Proechinophthirus fluctus]
MKKILYDANKKFNSVILSSVINLELVLSTIMAVQEENASIIINIGYGQMSKHGDGRIISGIVRMLAARATVSMAMNIVHGKDYKKVTHAFRHGFFSIMIDVSECPPRQRGSDTLPFSECHD